MPFSDVLRAQMRRPPGYSPGLVSRLSGVPKATIVNWLNGRVARPRRWQDLARVADAMRLGRDELDDLLSAANHPSVLELARRVDEDARVLLAPWVPPAKSDLLANAPLPIAATPFLGRTSERAALSALVCDAADGVKFGIGAVLVTEQRFAAHMLGRWQCGASSLVPLPTA
ncbi:MAG: helix-turn-helix domain-containing protein [Actinomycetota bacterium]|nr:helix-turn-helix domain-containing protein [Actinomycetota bacterium]